MTGNARIDAQRLLNMLDQGAQVGERLGSADPLDQEHASAVNEASTAFARDLKVCAPRSVLVGGARPHES